MTTGQFEALENAVNERREYLRLKGQFEELKRLNEAIAEVVGDNLPF